MTIKDIALLFVAVLQTIGVIFISWIYYAAELFKCCIPRALKRQDIKGKVSLITGSGSGLGRQVAQRLAKRGSKVVLWDVNAFGNEETAQIIKNEGGICFSYTVDLCDRMSVYKCAEMVRGDVGKVDILINNAGIVSGGRFLDLADEMIIKTFQVNTLSHFWTTKSFLPDMKEENSGHIVTIASVAGIFGVNRLVDYCSSKFANLGFHESLNLELYVDGYTGIDTTVVCPYYINTGMFDGVKSRILPILEQDYVADEIVDAILIKKRQLILPKFLNLLVALKGFFSSRTLQRIGHTLNLNQSMDSFVGRNKQK